LQQEIDNMTFFKQRCTLCKCKARIALRGAFHNGAFPWQMCGPCVEKFHEDARAMGLERADTTPPTATVSP
jgi:hypothetical protein